MGDIYNSYIEKNNSLPGAITFKNVGQFILPLVNYIKETRPQYIITLDRGGRLVGLATKVLYGELYGKLPTVDGTLRFARVSSTSTVEEAKNCLKPLVSEIMSKSGKSEPIVMVLDDICDSGHTMRTAHQALVELSNYTVDVRSGVMESSENNLYKPDVCGTKRFLSWEWEELPGVVGVSYAEGKAHIAEKCEMPFEKLPYCVWENENPPSLYRELMLRALRDFAAQIEPNPI